MKAPRIPSNEDERLEALQALEILDTAPDLEFDDITKSAAEICDTPIALISLVDKERQWFKSKQGLEAAETLEKYLFVDMLSITPKNCSKSRIPLRILDFTITL